MVRSMFLDDVSRRSEVHRASQRDELLDENEAAAILRQAPGTLKQWRYLGKGPAFVRIGRHARYLRSDVESFIAGNRVDPSAA